MTVWNPLLRETVPAGRPGGFDCVSFNFPVGEDMRRLRFRFQKLDHPAVRDETVRAAALQSYTNGDIPPGTEGWIAETIGALLDSASQRHWSVLIFDAARRFRGRWDKSFEDWKYVSAHRASEGFVGGELTPGRWTCTIVQAAPVPVPHSFLSLIEYSAEEDPPGGGAPYDLSVESIEEEPLRWVVGELHEHTLRGSGSMEPGELVETYHGLGFQFAVISDHDVQPLSALNRKPPIGVVRGQELETPLGHALLLGTAEFVHWQSLGVPRDLQDLISETHGQKGLFHVVHPFALGPDGFAPSWRWKPTPWMHVDLLEVWTGEWRVRFPEIVKAFVLWDSLLKQGIRIFGTCGKGGGPLDEERSARLPKTILLGGGLSETALLAGLKSGSFYSTLEPVIHFRLESESGDVQLGGELRLPLGKPYLLRIDITGGLNRAFIRILESGGVYCEMPLPSNKDACQLQFVERASRGVRWFRIEIHRYGRPLDELLAFTNPVFVRGISSM